MAEIVLIRHGETEWSRSRKHTGRTDLPLTADGERGARALAPLIAGRQFALVLSSPLERARRTAELAGLSPSIDDDLVEWDYGGYDGLTTAEITERMGRTWSIWTDGVVPGKTQGESIRQVADRAGRVLARAEPVLDTGNDVALVAHGHFLRILTALWLAQLPVEGRLFVLGAPGIGLLGFEHGQRALTGWNLNADLCPDSGG